MPSLVPRAEALPGRCGFHAEPGAQSGRIPGEREFYAESDAQGRSVARQMSCRVDENSMLSPVPDGEIAELE